MAKLTSTCSVCEVEFFLAGDEKVGDSVVCCSCGASFLIKRQGEEDSSKWDVEDEF
ncbi:MAG: lysine biosynthesis protein [Deltaproteobacteria bacterium]|nr:lysine biosynthesis protein [Deltaproteobacteria bacterium]